MGERKGRTKKTEEKIRGERKGHACKENGKEKREENKKDPDGGLNSKP